MICRICNKSSPQQEIRNHYSGGITMVVGLHFGANGCPCSGAGQQGKTNQM